MLMMMATAEFGAGINQRFGQVAVRFETNDIGYNYRCANSFDKI